MSITKWDTVLRWEADNKTDQKNEYKFLHLFSCSAYIGRQGTERLKVAITYVVCFHSVIVLKDKVINFVTFLEHSPAIPFVTF